MKIYFSKYEKVVYEEVGHVHDVLEQSQGIVGISVSEHLVVAAEPDPFVIVAEGLERIAFAPVSLRLHHLEAVVSLENRPSVGENPEITVSVSTYSEYSFSFQYRILMMMQDSPVETVETVGGSEPYVSVLFLIDAVDCGCQSFRMGNLCVYVLLFCCKSADKSEKHR